MPSAFADRNRVLLGGPGPNRSILLSEIGRSVIPYPRAVGINKLKFESRRDGNGICRSAVFSSSCVRGSAKRHLAPNGQEGRQRDTPRKSMAPRPARRFRWQSGLGRHAEPSHSMFASQAGIDQPSIPQERARSVLLIIGSTPQPSVFRMLLTASRRCQPGGPTVSVGARTGCKSRTTVRHAGHYTDPYTHPSTKGPLTHSEPLLYMAVPLSSV